MNPSADFSRTCKGCESLTPEDFAPGKTDYRCGHPGPRQGHTVGIIRLNPYIPAWCPKLIAEAQAKEATT